MGVRTHRPAIRARIAELQNTLAAGVITLEISDRNARVQALQNRWDRLRRAIDERAASPEFAEVPGGTKPAEILRDQRPNRKVAAMFIDMAFGSPIYERLRALGFNNVFETNFGLVQTPDRTKVNRRAYIWDKMRDWLLHGAIEADEKMAADLAGPGYHINRSNLLVLESKADMQKRGQASSDDGDALALTFGQPVAPAPLPRGRSAAYHWIVTLDSNACPAGIEDVAEAYVMGTLSEEQAVAFEDHYAACDTCATVLYKTADYVDAMRAAAKKLRAGPSRAASTSSPN